MQETMFSEYFDRCPIIYVSGRTYPVEHKFLPDALALIKEGQLLQSSQSDRKLVHAEKLPSQRGNKGKGRGGLYLYLLFIRQFSIILSLSLSLSSSDRRTVTSLAAKAKV